MQEESKHSHITNQTKSKKNGSSSGDKSSQLGSPYLSLGGFSRLKHIISNE
jgi:hypothetical protein